MIQKGHHKGLLEFYAAPSTLSDVDFLIAGRSRYLSNGRGGATPAFLFRTVLTPARNRVESEHIERLGRKIIKRRDWPRGSAARKAKACGIWQTQATDLKTNRYRVPADK